MTDMEAVLDRDPTFGPMREERRREIRQADERTEANERRRAAHPDHAAAEDRCEDMVLRIVADFVRLSRADRRNERAYLSGARDAVRIVELCRAHHDRDATALLDRHERGEMDLDAFGRALRLWATAEGKRLLSMPPRVTPAVEAVSLDWYRQGLARANR